MHKVVLAPAKLNLFLDIIGQRSDGYHLVHMVMQTVSLYDEVTVAITENSGEICVECSDSGIPCDETNTAFRAARLFLEQTEQTDCGVNVFIKKRIPSQAGMAGGSTDAAAVLLALNELLHKELSLEVLAKMGAKIGADVPFCLYGGTMTADGIGTVLCPLPDMPECFFVIVKPSVKISTAEAYRLSDAVGYDHPVSSDKVIDGICNGVLEDVAKGLYNKFEAIVSVPELNEIKRLLCEMGALGACMTGSGSAVFGIFEDEKEAEACAEQCRLRLDEVFTAKPVNHV